MTNRIAVSLIYVALALRVFVPTGFMPDVAALDRGEFKLTICSSSGTRSVVVYGHSEEKPAPSKKADIPGDCAFASASFDLFTPPSLELHFTQAETHVVAVPLPTLAVKCWYGTPFARAPPAIPTSVRVLS